MKFFFYFPFVTLLAIAIWFFSLYQGSFQSLWIKPDAQAQKFLNAGNEEMEDS